jgi:hypothetical protein
MAGLCSGGGCPSGFRGLVTTGGARTSLITEWAWPSADREAPRRAFYNIGRGRGGAAGLLEPVEQLRGRIDLVVVLAVGEDRQLVEVFGEPSRFLGQVDKPSAVQRSSKFGEARAADPMPDLRHIEGDRIFQGEPK